MPSTVEAAPHLRQALEDGDCDVLAKLWRHIAPHLPGPKTRAEIEIVLHSARTQAGSVTFRKRAYSHRWLMERGLPSHLPDDLRPKAERIYPRIVEGVGIAVKARDPTRLREARYSGRRKARWTSSMTP